MRIIFAQCLLVLAGFGLPVRVSAEARVVRIGYFPNITHAQA